MDVKDCITCFFGLRPITDIECFLCPPGSRPNWKPKKEKKMKCPFELPETPKVAVDAIIKNCNKLVVIERMFEPYGLAWPGGFVDVGETAEEAVVREALEETNLDIIIVGLIGVYSDPNRDSRGHIISIAYLCESVGPRPLRAKDDAKYARHFTIQNALKLAMVNDHNKMLLDALEIPGLNRRRT